MVKGYAAAAFAPVCADGFELGYLEGARVRQRTGLAGAAKVAFRGRLACPQLSVVPVDNGTRQASGLVGHLRSAWSCACTGNTSVGDGLEATICRAHDMSVEAFQRC
jgi:hypothetical protein